MSKAKWRPSKGSWGFLGTHSKSQAGLRARGKTVDPGAKSVKEGANQALQVLQRQFDRTTGKTGEEEGGQGFYQEQLDFAEDEKAVAEETFLAEADRKAGALRQQTTGEMRQLEQQTSQAGFAGSGTSGRARENLARSIQEGSSAIYEDLTTARVGKDIEMDKTMSSMEQEQLGELDRIEMEASGIINQTEQALSTMERDYTASNYEYKPTPGLDYFSPENYGEGVLGG